MIYLSVGVERVQRHGLARDPHRTPSRTAHRARIGLAGKAGTAAALVQKLFARDLDLPLFDFIWV